LHRRFGRRRNIHAVRAVRLAAWPGTRRSLRKMRRVRPVRPVNVRRALNLHGHVLPVDKSAARFSALAMPQQLHAQPIKFYLLVG
jgi:hypothetical protein